MRTPPEKYKYWLKFTRQTPGRTNAQDISWMQLVNLVSKCKPHQIEAVNFYHPEAPFGTGHVDGTTLLELWKQVERGKTGADKNQQP
jgi:hypothetical protein